MGWDQGTPLVQPPLPVFSGTRFFRQVKGTGEQSTAIPREIRNRRPLRLPLVMSGGSHKLQTTDHNQKNFVKFCNVPVFVLLPVCFAAVIPSKTLFLKMWWEGHIICVWLLGENWETFLGGRNQNHTVQNSSTTCFNLEMFLNLCVSVSSSIKWE